MKVARHEKIIELIRQYEIDTQEELAARLNEAGFKVTQATVSRDIRALKMTKGAGSNGKSRYAILEEHTPDVLSDKYSRVLKDAVIAMNIGQNIVVVKTIPGMAMAAAAAPQTVINERRVIFFIFISSKQVRAVCPGIFCCAFPGNGFIVPRRRPRCDQPRAKWR